MHIREHFIANDTKETLAERFIMGDSDLALMVPITRRKTWANGASLKNP